jgi:hypothetical protein
VGANVELAGVICTSVEVGRGVNVGGSVGANVEVAADTISFVGVVVTAGEHERRMIGITAVRSFFVFT